MPETMENTQWFLYRHLKKRNNSSLLYPYNRSQQTTLLGNVKHGEQLFIVAAHADQVQVLHGF